MEKILEMKDIVKDFGDFRAVDHVDFSMEKGEIVAIIGPSGSGNQAGAERYKNESRRN